MVNVLLLFEKTLLPRRRHLQAGGGATDVLAENHVSMLIETSHPQATRGSRQFARERLAGTAVQGPVDDDRLVLAIAVGHGLGTTLWIH